MKEYNFEIQECLNCSHNNIVKDHKVYNYPSKIGGHFILCENCDMNFEILVEFNTI